MGIAVYLFCAPLAVDAQQAGKVPRVGVLFAGSRSDPAFQRAVDAFQQGLVELGYVEGQSIAIEYREAQGKYERLPDLAAELVRLKVDVIVGATVPTIQAARQATKTIPIVMTLIADPVATGLVANVARPAGNITGLSTMAPDLMGKQLELLREVLPKASRVAVLWNPANPSNALQLREAQDAARALGVRLQPLEVRDPTEFEKAFAAMTRERAGALLVLSDSTLLTQRERIADLAAKEPPAGGIWDEGARGGWRPYRLRGKHLRHLASCRHLRRQDPQGG